MNVLFVIGQVSKAIAWFLVVVFVLYCLRTGIKEYRKERMVQNTERMWDLEQEAYTYEDDEDDIHIIIRRGKR